MPIKAWHKLNSYLKKFKNNEYVFQVPLWEKHMAGLKGEDSEWEIASKIGNCISSQCSRASGMSAHTLRRAYATMLLSQKLPMISIQRMMGHTKSDTTATYISKEELDNHAFNDLGLIKEFTEANNKLSGIKRKRSKEPIAHPKMIKKSKNKN